MENGRKLFGVGLSRTGTTTLGDALEILGYKSVHFAYDPRTQSEVLALYGDRSRPFKLTIADEYEAVIDDPIPMLFNELAEHYPHSRFILTVRERRAWLESCRKFWDTVVKRQYANIEEPAPGSLLPGGRQYADYCKACNVEVFGRPDFDADVFSTVYDRHVERVKAKFKATPERLLILDLCGGEGWKELCGFLDLPVPDRPLPHSNVARTTDAPA